MKALLTEIEIHYNAKLNDEELQILKKYNPKVDFKVIEHFAPYGDMSQEDKDKIKEEKFAEYLSQDRREILSSGTFVCDIQLFMHDLPKIKFTVTGTREILIEPNNVDALVQHQKYIDNIVLAQEERMKTMMGSFLKMSEDIANNLKVDTLNQKCDVHIGGGLLMTVNETMLLEDSCTDSLQGELNSGWRILAVCVQPDGRRPDYVLGRFNPDLSIGGHATRK